MDQSEYYPIEEYLMTKNRCYIANKRRVPTEIQVHSVGCKGTDRERWRRWNSSAYAKCPNAFVDTNGIMQCLDWNVRPWLSGSGKKGNANDTAVGFEICEPATSKDTSFVAAYLYGCTRWLCTQLCKEYGIHPANIKCHAELHKEGRASNHADVTHWWGKKGTSWEPYTMHRLRQDVAKALGVELPMETLRKGSRGDDVKRLQNRLNELGYNCGETDGIYGSRTVSAVKLYQKANGLTADGVAGPQTLGLLFPVIPSNEESPLYTVHIKHLTDADSRGLLATYATATREEETVG